MTQTAALRFVLTSVSEHMLEFCRAQSLTRDETIRVVEQTLQNQTVRAWAALQALRIAPAA
jgi:predicted lipoprotein